MNSFRSLMEVILGRFVFRERLELLEEKKRLYQIVTDPDAIRQYQLEKLNRVWLAAYTNLPFYAKWKADYNLPDAIVSLEELGTFPPLTKKVIYENQEFIQKGLEDFYLTSTGGTSGVTTHFPTSKRDADEAYANAYLGRSWWNIKPFSPILMYWGHSHLFGSGLKGVVKKIKRKMNDWLINTVKISSYGLDAGNVRRFYDAIPQSGAETIISYTSNLFKICKFMESERLDRPVSSLKNVILTSETATDADVMVIKQHLKAQVIHEYGMAETGVIAYSDGETDNIRILWDSFIIQVDGEGRLYLTSICEKVFPLFRYDSEDRVKIREEHEGNVLALRFIEGKVRNVLNVPSTGGETLTISTIFFDHVLKHYPGIYAVQYRQLANEVEIVLSSDKVLELGKIKNYMTREASKEFSDIDFGKVVLSQGSAEKTIAGKHRVMINSPICPDEDTQ
jgi:phenylacetate-CoA ligase